MVFRNIFLGAVFVAATAFAQPADSTTNSATNQQAFSTSEKVTSKTTIASLKKRKRVDKPETTWTKIKDLFN